VGREAFFRLSPVSSRFCFVWFVLFFSALFDRWGTSVVEWLGRETKNIECGKENKNRRVWGEKRSFVSPLSPLVFVLF